MLPKAFRGGIRFSEELRAAKETALHSPLRVFTPERLHLAVKEPLIPCVEHGASVRVGDCVATDPNGNTPPLHSGLSGTVTIREGSHLTLDGSICTLLTVEGDGKQAAASPLSPLPQNADRAALLQRMYDGGLVGLGGAGFPTFRKYSGNAAHHLLINACECEPYLAGDGRLVLEYGTAVREGVALFAKAGGVPSNSIFLCAENEAVARGLRHLSKDTGWTVLCLPERYPQGSEKQLIRAVLDIELPPGVYPSDWGILVSNVGTAVAMADAAKGLPLTHRTVTVSGAVAEPCNLLVPIGTPLRELATQAAPRLTGRRACLIAGGAMTGKRVVHPDAGLPKPCGGVLVLPAESEEESPCIRCGACVRACPSGLLPYLIDAAWLQHEDALCRRLHPDVCISCGCCSRVCPAQRQLAARITHIRRKGVNR